MTLTITIPNINKPKTVKDAVVSFLVQEWPLSAKKLYNKVRKAQFEVSYQAVHKAIKELLDRDIIERQERGYQLNKYWIRGIENFASQIRVAYEEKSRPPMEKFFTGETSTTTFHNLFEFLSFMVDFLTRLHDFQEEHGILADFRHLWWPLSFEGEGYKRFEKMGNGWNGTYLLCRKDTAADRLVFDFYNSFKPACKIRYGVGCSQDCDVCVIGDFVVQTFFTDELNKELDQVYKIMKDVKSTAISDFLKTLFFKKCEIVLVVTKSPTLAEQKRKQILKLFKEKA